LSRHWYDRQSTAPVTRSCQQFMADSSFAQLDNLRCCAVHDLPSSPYENLSSSGPPPKDPKELPPKKGPVRSPVVRSKLCFAVWMDWGGTWKTKCSCPCYSKTLSLHL